MRSARVVLAAALLCALAAASLRADISYFTVQGRACRTSYGCEPGGPCYFTVAVVTVVDGREQVPVLVKCDPAFPDVAAVCQQVVGVGRCVAFSGPILASINACPTLDARSANIPPDWECTPFPIPYGPC